MPASLSVVIPVYNSAASLAQCLASLSRSKTVPLEIIVVDDGSTDESASTARDYGTTVLSTEGRSGPARARNIGAVAARGEILVFLDADVCVYSHTLGRIAAEFAERPDTDAVMGSYDQAPAEQNFMSQYRNLMHCFVHHSGNRQATTFWGGCGAIRRQVFLEIGGFNEQYRKPSIEDIELGYRLSAANKKLALNAAIQVKHLKNWSVRGTLRTDFFQRALPWSELAIRSRRMPNDLNLRVGQRISVALVFALAIFTGYLALALRTRFLTALIATLFVLLSNYWAEVSLNRSPRVVVAALGILALIAALSLRAHMPLVGPMAAIAGLSVYLRRHYSDDSKTWWVWSGRIAGGYGLLVIAFVWMRLVPNPLVDVFLAALSTVVALNIRFYGFLARQRGKLFALAVIPFHLVYFLCSGVGFVVALIRCRFVKYENATPLAMRVEAAAEKQAIKAAAG